jgi:hypothetical protein
MEVVDSLYSGYGDKVFAKYDTLLKNKRAFLDSFPKLDSIRRCIFDQAKIATRMTRIKRIKRIQSVLIRFFPVIRVAILRI